MKYMLDTNIIAYAKNRRPGCVLTRMMQHHPSDLCISAVTMAELEYGVYSSSRPAQNRLGLMLFLAGMEILPFGTEAAQDYGLIRHLLRMQGTPIGANDLMIAAHARSLGLVLVTNNVREFCRVPGLKLENWAEP
ncbi:MAG: type II toxin-antitoxin system VapC family toxin [Eubacteriales bacterium]|nr:type II toxin-antitoxin system VapC family toxin [Eubacteriales bacterium]